MLESHDLSKRNGNNADKERNNEINLQSYAKRPNNHESTNGSQKAISRRIEMTGLPLSTQIITKQVETNDTLQSIALKNGCTVRNLSILDQNDLGWKFEGFKWDN